VFAEPFGVSLRILITDGAQFIAVCSSPKKATSMAGER
jgi:hypothetical protein